MIQQEEDEEEEEEYVELAIPSECNSQDTFGAQYSFDAPNNKSLLIEVENESRRDSNKENEYVLP